MIICKLTLRSAVTGQDTDLGTLQISNDGSGTTARGNYEGRTLAKNTKRLTREGTVLDHERNALSAWVLVRKMLQAMDY